MVDSKTQKISIGEVIKDPELLSHVPDHFKNDKMCKHAVKNLPFLTEYVSDQYKTQQMYYKVILKNVGVLMFMREQCKDQNMCNNAVDNYPHALGSFPDCFV